MFNKYSKKMIEHLEEKVDADEFDVKHFVGVNKTCETLETIIGFEVNDQLGEKVFHELEDLFTRTGRNIILYILTKPFQKILNLDKWYNRQCEKNAKAILDEVLESRKKYNDESSNLFVDRVIQMEKNTKIPNVNALEHLGQMFGGATDTSTMTISNIILLLAMHPEVQEKCYQEVRSVWIDPDTDIDLDLIPNMTYLDMTIKECMRIIPTAAFVMKTSDDAVEFGIMLINGKHYINYIEDKYY